MQQLGCVMTMTFLLHLLIHAESEKMLGSLLHFIKMHRYSSSLCFNLSVHSALSPFHFSLSLSPFSIQHLLQLCKGPHLKQPGVTFNLEVL